jgi:hypothetical protein
VRPDFRQFSFQDAVDDAGEQRLASAEVVGGRPFRQTRPLVDSGVRKRPQPLSAEKINRRGHGAGLVDVTRAL